ncbi:S-protein homolog 5-like [Lycium ferocissimum]|uniref:S-protein homolog 5-like n=1 Tax=Lycium ferocissimum TaxID=112874 RepID=UPI002814C089|nr:S-protein homolog 5-like [Lycium ferocissimum]
MTKAMVLSAAILIILVQTVNSALTKGFTMHIINALQNDDVPLSVHCESKDDDLGIKYPKVGDDFHFSFRGDVFAKTRFYCHYSWGSKKQFFDVFSRDISRGCGRINGNNYECFWKVQDDGFYFAGHNSPESYSKKFDWNV